MSGAAAEQRKKPGARDRTSIAISNKETVLYRTRYPRLRRKTRETTLHFPECSSFLDDRIDADGYSGFASKKTKKKKLPFYARQHPVQMASSETSSEPINTLHHVKTGSIWATSTMLDLLLPPACRLCSEPVETGRDFCHGCFLALSLSDSVMRSACQRCGRPGGIAVNATKLSGASADVADGNAADRPPTPRSKSNDPLGACVHCQKENYQFDQVVAHWTYQGRVCDAIVAAKYAQQSALGHALGRQLGKQVAAVTAADPPEIVTYVPSHFQRQWARGGRSGNVAIAQAVVNELRRYVPTVSLQPLLRTTRRIAKQAWLSDVERRKNVSGAFAAKKSYAWPRDLRIFAWPETRSFPGKNKHILVVDDVLTTGATANEVAKVLRHAGARRVTLAVVARAVWSK